MNANGMSRREFLKVSIAALGGSVLACSGLCFAATRPPDLAAPERYFGKDDSMERNILVAYATRAGSTPEVAAVIGEVIAARGYYVEVKPVKEKPALAEFHAVVLGSAIRMGAWLPEAVAYIRENKAQLNRMPNMIFTLHMLNTGDDEASRQARQAYITPIHELIEPQGEAFFSGVMDYAKLSLLDRLIAKAVEKNSGVRPGDYRDWDTIREWAQTIPVDAG